MSDKYNDEWLEAAKEWFEESIEVENWAQCRAIIEDLKENGFAPQALVLERTLSEKQNNHGRV